MKSISANSVSAALAAGISHLMMAGGREQSRNGAVLVAPTPVTTTYTNPIQRVLFSPTRDANPFFHLMESLWMLAGRNDLEFPKYFNSRFGAYSDDGATIHGAYGHRWINHFGFDQLDRIVEILTKDPNSRRAVLSMWDAPADLDPNAGADVPCNTQAYFDLRGGRLNMTVVNRSNDAIWGAYGANAVHFSVLLEVLAARLAVGIGVYRQMSNNLHVYTDIYSEEKLAEIAAEAHVSAVDQYPEFVYMVDLPWEQWHAELLRFMAAPAEFDNSPSRFFQDVARPVFQAWHERRTGKGDGLYWAQTIAAQDWGKACVEWIQRRIKAQEAAK